MDPALWHRPDMRTALAARNIAAVFRLLQRVGVSQRRIAALTGQSQSEISEILGGRQVVSYDVLARIADGLGIPRGHLGLAYDAATARLVGAEPASGAEPDDGRRMLARVTELAVGAATVDPQRWVQPFPLAWPAAPERVGLADVRRLESMTAQLRAIDHEHGGGACRDAVLAQLEWGQRLLRASVAGDADRSLHLAIADLHLLAGWTSFDLGGIGPARRHFARAVEHARFVEESALVAKALYCLGRLHVHHGWGAEALRLFQLGQVSAQQSGSDRAVAVLEANLAWAYAAVGDTRQALNSIGRARDEYARSEQEAVPAWMTFFDSAELQALRATALAALPEPTPQQRAEAIDRFWLSTALRELPMARPRAFELSALAWLLCQAGDLDQSLRIGHQAVDLAAQLRSQRVVDRLAPLVEALRRHHGGADVKDLLARIEALPRYTPVTSPSGERADHGPLP